MKSVEIRWNKEIFDGEKKLLPNKHTLYSQIYDVPKNGDSWSLVYDFKITPRIQGYFTKGTVRLLNEAVSEDFLYDGMEFPFMDGPHCLAKCRIIDNRESDEKIIEALAQVEDSRRHLHEVVSSLENYRIDDGTIDLLCEEVRQYPFLFFYISKRDKNKALGLVKNGFLVEDFVENVLEWSNLAYFCQVIRDDYGEEEVSGLLGSVDLNVQSKDIVENLLFKK